MSQSHIVPFSGGSTPISASGPGKPRVLWNNLMLNGSPTLIEASSEPDPLNYPYQNSYDGRPYTYWKVAAGTNYLTFVFPSAKTVNSYAYYSPGEECLQNLGGEFQLEYSVDGGANWVPVGDPEAPIDSTPIYRVMDTPISAARWRWRFTCASDFYVACLSFGEDFEFERGCWVGLSPSSLARATVLSNNTSQEGNWLGRSIIRQGCQFNFDLEWLSFDFVFDEWLPFVEWAETGPWFCLWNADEYPADAAFCWSADKIPPPKIMHPNFMSAKMKVEGRTN